MRPNNCPVCGAPDGFHDEAPHAAARAAIPPELVRPSNSALRRERRAEEHAAEIMDMERRQQRALERRFAEGADGRKLLADMAAALLES
jgi:hypothetical protein